MFWTWLACSEAPPAAPPPPIGPCAEARAPAPGPAAAEAAAAVTALDLARIRLREARLTGDPGFYTLADLALACAAVETPNDPEVRALQAHVLVQFHRFAEAEAILGPLADATGAWHHLMFLGDARLDQGNLDGARQVYEQALALRPGLELYDRLADVSWATGDLDAAIGWEERAFAAASPSDAEPMAWVASRLGWYRALKGEGPPNELGVAVQVLPDHRPSRLLLGRFLLGDGHPELAVDHLRAAGETIEALRVLHEIDPTVDPARAKLQDRRGWAILLAETDPREAARLLDLELGQRHDATTRIARAWVGAKLGEDVAEEIRSALATGIADPPVLLMAAEAIRDRELAKRALERQIALLPSERERARLLHFVDR